MIIILNDNQLMSMSDNDFQKWLDGYTVNAKERV